MISTIKTSASNYVCDLVCWPALLTLGVVSSALLPDAAELVAAEKAADGAVGASERGESATEAEADPLSRQIDEAIEVSSRRYLTVGLHTPWQIMHGLLALRQDFQIKQGEKKICALEWLANSAVYHGQPLFEITEYGGRAHPYTQPYVFQGHANQFLAVFAVANVPLDYELRVEEKTLAVADLVKNTQMNVDGSDEITWTLWALSHYLEPYAQWTNKWGHHWSIEELVERQLRESITNSACGGAHALVALTCARNRYKATDRPLEGVWLQANQVIEHYSGIAKTYQNEDGTLSADYFTRPGHAYDAQMRLDTTGHTLEWLSIALTVDELKEEWIRRAAAAVAQDLLDHRDEPIECGPLYHAVGSLVNYRDRTHLRKDHSERTAATHGSKLDRSQESSGREGP